MAAHKPSVTVLLGAGASVPFLQLGGKPLSTKSITKDFRDTNRWRRAWTQFESERKARPGAGIIKDRLDINEALRLRSTVDKFLRRSSQFSATISFEPMVHLVDRASALLQGQAPVNVMQLDACLPALLAGAHQSARETYSLRSDPDGWRSVPSLAREVVLSTVLDAWEESSRHGVASTIQLHQDFYRQLAAEHEQVSVYSLNYDPLIFEALAPLGFATGFLSSGTFYPPQFYQDFVTQRLAFLHGHVGFTLNASRTVFNRNYRAAQSARIKGIVGGGGTSVTPKGIHANALMITGLDKFEAFSREPFSTYMLRFSRDVQESEHIIIIGASLGDNHLNTFLIDTTTLDPGKKVIFVTHATPRAILNAMGKPSASPRGQLLTLLSTLRPIIRRATLGKYWRALAKDVRRNGYGEAADGLLLYARGTETFYGLGSTAPLFAMIRKPSSARSKRR